VNVYVTEQGAYVRKNHGRIEVLKDGELLCSVPARDVTLLVVFGNVQVTTQAMFALLEQGTDISFLAVDGHFKGKLVAAKSKDAPLRVRQHERIRDPDFALVCAKEVIAAKLKGAVDLLRRYNRNRHNPGRVSCLDELENFAESARRAPSRESLLGYEGNAARVYWHGFKEFLREKMGFEKRVFHPSTDPVNALLSFGYSFLAREMQGILESLGLDPYIGFYHTVTYGRASLSLDLIEPFRHSFVDALVLKMVNRRVVGEGDFYRNEENGGVYLRSPSVRKFIKFYEAAADEANSYYEVEGEPLNVRKMLWRTAERFKKAVNEDVIFRCDA